MNIEGKTLKAIRLSVDNEKFFELLADDIGIELKDVGRFIFNDPENSHKMYDGFICNHFRLMVKNASKKTYNGIKLKDYLDSNSILGIELFLDDKDTEFYTVQTSELYLENTYNTYQKVGIDENDVLLLLISDKYELSDFE